MLKEILKLMAITACISLAAVAQGQTLDFTLGASSSDGKTVVPKLTWNTTPAATSCTGSGSTGWAGTKAVPSGTQTLAPVTTSQNYVMQCNWATIMTATLNWTAPTTNVDGSALTDLSGYRVQYGRTATDSGMDSTVYLQNPATLTWVSPTLSAGTWYFGVKSFNTLGLESPISNIVSKVIVAGVTRSVPLDLTIKIPGAPVLTVQ